MENQGLAKLLALLDDARNNFKVVDITTEWNMLFTTQFRCDYFLGTARLIKNVYEKVSEAKKSGKSVLDLSSKEIEALVANSSVTHKIGDIKGLFKAIAKLDAPDIEKLDSITDPVKQLSEFFGNEYFSITVEFKASPRIKASAMLLYEVASQTPFPTIISQKLIEAISYGLNAYNNYTTNLERHCQRYNLT